jgi:chromosome segregation ATPase
MRIEENDNVTVNPTPKSSIAQPIIIGVLAVALGTVTFMLVNTRQDQQRMGQTIADLNEKNQSRIDALEQRTSSVEMDAASLHTQGSTLDHQLQDTQKHWTSSARKFALAKDLNETKDQTEQKLTSINEVTMQHENKLGAIDGDITSVKGNLNETKANLDGVSTKLEGAVGDINSHSGLIARNHDELAELRKKGERDYAEFDLKKAKDYTRVSDLSLRLTKADPAHQKYSLAVVVADKHLERRDKTALEPVQFYLTPDHKLVEIVVWDVNKDHVVGYISSPKV